MKKRSILLKHSLPQIMENLPAREWELSDDGRIRAQQLLSFEKSMSHLVEPT